MKPLCMNCKENGKSTPAVMRVRFAAVDMVLCFECSGTLRGIVGLKRLEYKEQKARGER